MTKSQLLFSSDDAVSSHPVNSLSSSGMANRLQKVPDDDYGSKRNQVVMNCYYSKPFQLGDNDSVSVDLSRSEAMSNAASDVIDKSSKVPHSRMNRKDMSKQ
jgi:hypothetical protein